MPFSSKAGKKIEVVKTLALMRVCLGFFITQTFLITLGKKVSIFRIFFVENGNFVKVVYFTMICVAWLIMEFTNFFFVLFIQ